MIKVMVKKLYIAVFFANTQYFFILNYRGAWVGKAWVGCRMSKQIGGNY